MPQRKGLSPGWVITLLALTPATATASDLTLTFIDVGQGDATLISADDLHILVDGGTPRHDVADHLRGEGIGHIDLLVATHPHADHIGGQVGVLERKSVGTIWYSGDEHTTQTFEAWIDAALEADADYREPVRGEGWEAEDLAVTLLHPAAETGGSDLHDRNLVVRIEHGECSALITGDIERDREAEILDAGVEVDADVLELGHHGSRTSTGSRWLDAVQPDIAVVQYRAGNQYDHPHGEVLDRVQATGAEVLGTGAHGSIELSCDSAGEWHIATERTGTVRAGDGADDAADAETGGGGVTSRGAPPSSCIDLNRAPRQDLEEIVHIGPNRAEEIVDGRRWSSVGELDELHGIGRVRLQEIKEQGDACVR